MPAQNPPLGKVDLSLKHSPVRAIGPNAALVGVCAYYDSAVDVSSCLEHVLGVSRANSSSLCSHCLSRARARPLA